MQCTSETMPIFKTALRRAMMFIGFRLMTIFPPWFSTSIRVRTMPRSGFEREGVASSTVDPDAQYVPRPNRMKPTQLVDAGRGEARPLRQKIVGEQPHHHRSGMPAAGDQTAEAAALCRLGVDMHVLRVEAAGEVEDFGLVDPDLPVLEYRARYVVLEVSLFGQ